MSWDGNCWRNLTWPYRRLMIIVVPLKPQNFKSASSTFQRVLELSVHLEFSLIKNPKEPDKTAARSCKFCGYKHPVTQPSHCPAFGKQCLKCKKEDHFSQVCPRNVKEGSKVDSLQQESPQERKKQGGVYLFWIYWAGNCFPVPGNQKRALSLIEGKNVELKADAGAETNVIP